MLDNSLRPIGTEFKMIRRPSPFSNDPKTLIYTWRVVRHAPIEPTGVMAEVVECVDLEVSKEKEKGL